MELKNLESFIRVAELGSFTKAAEKLGYSQSTISFQIKQLEEDLKVPLFERVNHSIKLTAKGNEVLCFAHQIVQLTSGMERLSDSIQEPHGQVRVAVTASLCNWLIDNNYKAFHERYPHISLIITETGTEEIFDLLNQNEIDLGCTLDTHIFHRNCVVVSKKLIGTHFIASPHHPFAREKEIPYSEIVQQPFILTEKGKGYRKYLDEKLTALSTEINPFLEIGDTNLICHLVEQEMGFSFLPDFATEDMVKQGRLVRLEVPELTVDVWKQLLCHRDKWISPEIQIVSDYLSSSMEKNTR